MKIIVTTVLLAAVVCVLGQDGSVTKYDNVELHEILRNDRLTRKYVDCALDKASCTKDGAELKGNIIDVFKTGCSKCNANQKIGVKQFCNHLMKNKPDIWTALTEKYDPKGEFKTKYNQFLKT